MKSEPLYATLGSSMRLEVEIGNRAGQVVVLRSKRTFLSTYVPVSSCSFMEVDRCS